MKAFLFTAAFAVPVLASPAVLPLEARQSGQTCYAGIYAVVCRGTFEQQNITGFGFQGSIVTPLLAAIPNSGAISVVYPAAVNDYGSSVQQGAIDALKKITDYNTACPNSKIVIMGYSQGAQVMGNALAGGSSYIPVLGGRTGPNDALPTSVGSKIIAVNFLGDPNRVKGQGQDADPKSCTTSSSTPRNGTAYPNFQYYADRVNQWCHDGDPVCCANGSDPGSHIAYVFSQSNIDQMVNFIVAKYKSS